MKNRYEVDGDVTRIFLIRRDGRVLVTLIDTEDLEAVSSCNWYAYWSKLGKSFYAYNQNLLMHRLIMKAPRGKQVDHINHNTLDNRKNNLRVVTSAQNNQNRSGARSDNRSSGIRGVTWSRQQKKWRARYMLNGIDYHVGFFDDLIEAAQAVKQARAKHMPYSYEAYERSYQNA
ncbi:HNH endonuclease [Paenibacillus sp. MB22_1]|uniref:HNH endonuclease n=1 Tax=Paenibacillus sp. MB22_1 TaxID=3383121 RepID=UPI00399F6757